VALLLIDDCLHLAQFALHLFLAAVAFMLMIDRFIPGKINGYAFLIHAFGNTLIQQCSFVLCQWSLRIVQMVLESP